MCHLEPAWHAVGHYVGSVAAGRTLSSPCSTFVAAWTVTVDHDPGGHRRTLPYGSSVRGAADAFNHRTVRVTDPSDSKRLKSAAVRWIEARVRLCGSEVDDRRGGGQDLDASFAAVRRQSQ